MKNVFTKLALVGALASGILGAAGPATGALAIREVSGWSYISTIVERDANGSASGTRATYSAAPGLFASHIATNTLHSLARATASASHVCDFRTNEDSIHLTFDGQSEVSHGATSPEDGVTRLDAESAFRGTLAFTADAAFSYTLIPFRSASLTNADASILFERSHPDSASPGDYIAIGAGFTGVWETNGTIAMSGTAPAGDYALNFDVTTVVDDEIKPILASAGFASLIGFEFRATTLPPPSTPPRLEASSVGGSVVLSWPFAYQAFDLEEAQAVGGLWSPVTGTRALVGGRLVVTVEASNASRFFRLKGHL